MAVHRRVGDAPPRPHESRPEPDSRLGWTHRKPAEAPPFELELLTTPPYPARAVESIGSGLVVQGGGFFTATVDRLSLVGDVTGGQRVQVIFPPIEYFFAGPGQTPEEAFEGLSLVGDVIGGQRVQVLQPEVDYELTEGLSLVGDVTGGQRVQVYFPVDYTNWPLEGLSLVGDVIGGQRVTV